MMLMHTAGIKDMPSRVSQGKALIKFLADSCSEDTPYGKYLRQELELLKNVDDSYIAHDFFEIENDALYLTDFLKSAAAHKLQYLGDAEPATMVVDNLPAEAAKTLKSLNLNLLATEQYMDFVRNRMFRSTLLCHPEAQLNRNVDPKTLDGLEVTSFIRLKTPRAEGQPAVFVGPAGNEFTVNDAIPADLFSRVAALDRSTRPASEIVEETAAAFASELEGKDPVAVRNDLGRLLIQGYFKKMVDFTIGPASRHTAQAASEQPEVLPLARWQTSRRQRVSSTRLEMLTADPFVAKFIGLCDGTRDRGAIIDALTESLANKEYQLNENNQPIEDMERGRFVIERLYDGSLQNLEKLGLLVPANGQHS